MRSAPFGVTTLILRTCRNCTGVMEHWFCRILARVQDLVFVEFAVNDAWKKHLGAPALVHNTN